MSKALVPDGCGWRLRRCYRLNRQDRGLAAALTGIVFVLRAGVPKKMLPAEIGRGLLAAVA